MRLSSERFECVAGGIQAAPRSSVSMSWRERDYHRTSDASGGDYAAGGRIGLPRPASLVLLGMHAVAFCALIVSRAADAAPVAFHLSSANLGLTALLAHPLASTHPIALALTVFGIWTLARRIECRYGGARVVLLYVAGNLAAGLAFLAYASLVPSGAAFALSMPVGGLAAWCGAAWLGMRDEYVSVFGRVVSMARASAIAAAVVAGLVVMSSSSAATAWLVAAIVAGGSGMLMHAYGPSLSFRFKRRRPVTRPAKAERPRAPSAPDVDAILDKIGQEGVDSLSAGEREELEAARRAMLDQEQ